MCVDVWMRSCVCEQNRVGYIRMFDELSQVRTGTLLWVQMANSCPLALELSISRSTHTNTVHTRTLNILIHTLYHILSSLYSISMIPSPPLPPHGSFD